MGEPNIHFVRHAVLESNPAVQDWGISETSEWTRWRAVLDSGLRIRLTSIRFDDGTRGLQLDEIRGRGRVTSYFGNDIIAVTALNRVGQQ